MAPNRSIRDFFQPRPPSQDPKPLAPRDAAAVQQIDKEFGRHIWPSPSSRTPTASPALTQISLPHGAVAPRKTPQPNIANQPPAPSQSSSNSSSSKRIIRNGEEAVANSDSDTDSSDLPDLDDFVRHKPTPPPQKAPASINNGDVKPADPRATRFRTSVQKHGRKPVGKPFKPSESSLSFLAKAAQEDAERKKEMSEIKAELEKSDEDDPDMVIDERVLAKSIRDDEDGDKSKRLMNAVKRTEVLRMDCAWHFFEQDATKTSARGPLFPVACLPRHAWRSNFEDSRKRDQSFVSGFARQLFQCGELPEELAVWMIDQLTLKPREMLNAEYLAILDIHPRYYNTILSSSKLLDIFRSIGAKASSLDPSSQIIHSDHLPNITKKPLPPSLKWLIFLLHNAAEHLSSEARFLGLTVLLCLSFDDSVENDIDLQTILQRALERMICTIPETELNSTLHRITGTFITRLTHPILQKNLVFSLPTNSPLTVYFQRHLALSFLFGPIPPDAPLPSEALSTLVSSHLANSPKFSITQDTNFAILISCVTLLDIGIGPGLLPVPYVAHVTAGPAPTPTGTPRPIISSEEKHFNDEIDALVTQIKKLSNNIITTGAMSDLATLEAKNAYELLFHRLDSAVRTRGPKRNVVFAGMAEAEEEEEEKKRVWGSWFGKRNVVRVGEGSATSEVPSSVNGA